MFKLFWVHLCVWCEIRVQFNYFIWIYPVFSTNWRLYFPIVYSWHSWQNHLIHMCEFISLLSILLVYVYVYVLVLVSYCFNYSSLQYMLKLGSVIPLFLLFIFQKLFRIFFFNHIVNTVLHRKCKTNFKQPQLQTLHLHPKTHWTAINSKTGFLFWLIFRWNNEVI